MDRVLVDVDDTLLDYRAVLADAAQKVVARELDMELPKTEWALRQAWSLTDEELEAILHRVAKVASLRPARGFQAFPGAVEGVQRLAEVADVYFVTAPTRELPTWVYDRDAWLVEHFGEELGSKVVHTSHKHLVAGHYLVDDRVATLENWEAEMRRLGVPATAVCWAQPYNLGAPFMRIEAWSTLIGTIVRRARM